MTPLFYPGFSEGQVDDFETSLEHILANLVEYEQKSE